MPSATRKSTNFTWKSAPQTRAAYLNIDLSAKDTVVSLTAAQKAGREAGAAWAEGEDAEAGLLGETALEAWLGDSVPTTVVSYVEQHVFARPMSEEEFRAFTDAFQKGFNEIAARYAQQQREHDDDWNSALA